MRIMERTTEAMSIGMPHQMVVRLEKQCGQWQRMKIPVGHPSKFNLIAKDIMKCTAVRRRRIQYEMSRTRCGGSLLVQY
jgi:hypothetical protein